MAATGPARPTGWRGSTSAARAAPAARPTSATSSDSTRRPPAPRSTSWPPTGRTRLDKVVAGLCPAGGGTRRAYSQALAQRNALLARVRGGAGRDALRAWDLELARHAIALRDDRARAVDLLVDRFAQLADELGLGGTPELRYR